MGQEYAVTTLAVQGHAKFCLTYEFEEIVSGVGMHFIIRKGRKSIKN